MKPLPNDDMIHFWVWTGLILFCLICWGWVCAGLTEIDWTTLIIYDLIRSVMQ